MVVLDLSSVFLDMAGDYPVSLIYNACIYNCVWCSCMAVLSYFSFLY